MRTGDIFRVPKPQRPDDAVIDGFPNLYSITRAAGGGVLPFAAGINTMAAVTGLSGAARRPAVIIRSSPHKAGSDVTPWQNRFDPDLGQIRYFGDNKYPNRRAAHEARGNRSLLALRELHKSTESDERLQAAPLIFFRTTPVAGKAKGHVRFDGYGIIYRTELVTTRARSGAVGPYRGGFPAESAGSPSTGRGGPSAGHDRRWAQLA